MNNSSRYKGGKSSAFRRFTAVLLSAVMIGLAAITSNISANAAGLSGMSAVGSGTDQTVNLYQIDTDAFGGTVRVYVGGTISSNAAQDEQVIISVYTPSGYSLKSLTVTGKSKTVYQTEDRGNGAYAFTMPAEKVTVSAKFDFDKGYAYSGDVFWVDTQPSVTDSPLGLVKWSSYSSSGSSDYYLYLPGGTKLNDLHVYYGSGSPVINGTTLYQGAEYTFEEGKTYTINGKTVRVMMSDSASLYLQTGYDLWQIPYGSMIDKERSLQTNGQFMSADKDGNVVDKPQLLAQIKGRGNSSWEASCKLFGKYSYNIKLGKKADVLNMGAVKAKSFCLLANNMDESLLRNVEVYRAAAMAGLGFVPHYEIADLYNNGNYLGSYLITEKIDVGSSKLVQGETVEDYHNDPAATNYTKKTTYTYNGGSYQYQYVDTGAIDAGVDYTKKSYLLEFDLKERATAERCWFVTPKGQYIAVKAPDDLNQEEMLFIINKWVDAEYAVYSRDLSGMKSKLDLDSFADVYLIQEFTKNLDSCASSYYVYYDGTQQSPKWQAAPIWDYDWTLGNYDTPYWHKKINANGDPDGNNKLSNSNGWFAKYKCIIVSDSEQLGTWSFQAQLCNNSTFWNNYVVRAWNSHIYSALKAVFPLCVTNDYNLHTKSYAMNEARYGFVRDDPISSWGSVDTGDTPADTAAYLKSWAQARLNWMHMKLAVPFSGVSLTANEYMVARNEEFELTAVPYPDYTTGLNYNFMLLDGEDYTTVASTTNSTVTLSYMYGGTAYYKVTATDGSRTYESEPVAVKVLNLIQALQPTCTDWGYQAVYHDQDTSQLYLRKDGVFEKVTFEDIKIPALGHDLVTEDIAPTCTERGYTLHSCTRCTYSYKDNYVDAKGHSCVDEVVEPTDTEQGYVLHSCKDCTYSYKDGYFDKLKNTATLSAEGIVLGESVTVTGSSTGGRGASEYAFYSKKTTDTYFKTLKAFDETTQAPFKPLSAGTYTIRTKAKDGDGRIAVKDLTLEVAPRLANTTELSAEIVTLGGSITINGSAAGGASPYEFVFYSKKSTDTYFKTVKALDATAEAAFKPLSAGTYTIRTKVKDERGKIVTKDLTLEVAPRLVNTSELSAYEITLGGSVTVNGSAEGGVSPYEFAVYTKKSTDTYFKTLKAFDETAETAYKPLSAGTYTIRTKVKEQTGRIVTKDLTLEVAPKLVNTTELSAESVSLGESITINGSAAGGISPYEFAFYYKKSTDTYYKTLKAFDETAEAVFDPASAGTYTIRTKVRGADGRISVKDLTAEVKK